MRKETAAGKPKVDITNTDNKEKKLETKEEKYWLIHVRIPRRHIEELYDDDLELYDDDVEDTNIDAASDARDEDIDSSNAFKEDGNDETPNK